MDPITMAAIMGGAGLAKGVLFDQPAADQNRKMQAAMMQYSPWTGMRPDLSGIQGQSPLAPAMQGAMAGAQLGQAAEQSEAYKNFLDKMNAQQGMQLSGMRSPWLNAAPVA